MFAAVSWAIVLGSVLAAVAFTGILLIALAFGRASARADEDSKHDRTLTQPSTAPAQSEDVPARTDLTIPAAVSADDAE